jgi:hypothetical protein
VGLTVVNSTFVLLLDICAHVELTFFNCPTIANTQTVMHHAIKDQTIELTTFKLKQYENKNQKNH